MPHRTRAIYRWVIPSRTARHHFSRLYSWSGVRNFHRSRLIAGPATLQDSVLGALDNTPLIQLQQLAPSNVNVFVKHEAMNPLLSMKDRLSAGCLEWAEHESKLAPGQTVVDALTGNTGIGLAMSCAQRGYPLVVVVSPNMPTEWCQLSRLLGTKVLVAEKPEEVAQRIAGGNGWFYRKRFQAEANAWIHENKVAPEILSALGDRTVDYAILPHGTGGMLRGVGKVLRSRSPSTRICVVEQDSKPHPEYEQTVGPHFSWPGQILKGWTTEFAPTPIAEDLKEKYIDEMVTVSGQEAIMVARQLASSECILTGISGGALTAAALKVAYRLPAGSSVVTVLLDTSLFVFRTPLAAGVPETMSQEELELLNSVQ